MKIYFDEYNKPDNKTYVYTHTVDETIHLIGARKNTKDPVEELSIPGNDNGMKILQALRKWKNAFSVHVRGDMTPAMYQMIIENHWNRMPMELRTAEIIMVLKGNHNLFNGLIDEAVIDGDTYLRDVALYLSDDCGCPYSVYQKDPSIVESVVRQTVVEYMRVCDNPSLFLREYFEAKRLFGSLYNDTQCWCSALASQTVREDRGTYVNGFTSYNTKKYTRQRPFVA